MSSASAPVAIQPSPAATPGGIVSYYCEGLCYRRVSAPALQMGLLAVKSEFDEGTRPSVGEFVQVEFDRRDSVNRTLTYLRYSNIVAIQLIGLCRNYAIEHSRRSLDSNLISCTANKGSFRTRIPQSLVAAASYTGEYLGAELRRSSAGNPSALSSVDLAFGCQLGRMSF
ncbi:unnamed protein product [Trichogramma brassicae]|uniref:Uncharacterized protein n=1 Tax=Trichogramma brassicae TaxID=86971 RepID=A0A6H5J2W3_9HYME|nr:unnamed protein product [Trichogramma brassicae]